MRFDRREFIWYSAAGALAFGGCCKKTPPTVPSGSQQNAGPPAKGSLPTGPSLQIEFEGLYLMEVKDHSMVVHLVDGCAVGAKTHTPQMKIRGSVIESTTAKPDSEHTLPAGNNDYDWLWDLQGLKVTAPESDTGQDDLSFQGATSQDGNEFPTDDEGWSSLARVPDLRKLCGATKVEPESYKSFTSSIALKHGFVQATKPDGVGYNTAWGFTDPAGNLLMRRAFSNRLRCTCSTQGKALTIHFGSETIVFKPDVTARVLVTNNPPRHPGCPPVCRQPNMNHFLALLELVDRKFYPAITSTTRPSEGPGGVDPDYCPGGRI